MPQPRIYPPQPSSRYLNVIGWFRSTSPDAEVVSTLPLRYNDSFDMCPLHLSTFPSHTSVTDFTVSIFLYIIGLFRSTVLLVMSQTRFLCATMMVVIVWFRTTSSDILLVGTHPLRFDDFYIIGWFRSTSSTVVGTHPLRFNDSVPPPHTY